MALSGGVIRTELVDGVLFRYANYDTPLWARNNRTNGRWHVVGDGATQYLSVHPDAAWADLARRENLRTEDELRFVQTTIWALSVTQANLADYSTFSKAEAAGFPPDALIDDDHERCRAEGQRLRELGYAGVLAPSASLPGEICVTLFGRRVRSRWGVPTKLASSIPCAVVAVGGPAAGLSSKVRYVGEPHLGYEMYLERRGLLATETTETLSDNPDPSVFWDIALSGEEEDDDDEGGAARR